MGCMRKFAIIIEFHFSSVRLIVVIAIVKEEEKKTSQYITIEDYDDLK